MLGADAVVVAEVQPDVCDAVAVGERTARHVDGRREAVEIEDQVMTRVRQCPAHLANTHISQHTDNYYNYLGALPSVMSGLRHTDFVVAEVSASQ